MPLIVLIGKVLCLDAGVCNRHSYGQIVALALPGMQIVKLLWIFLVTTLNSL
jgi:hypothetical protein